MSLERFIPFRKSDVISMCQSLFIKEEQPSFIEFAELFASVIHFEYHKRLEVLKDNYAPFDPNADTQLLKSISDDEKLTCQKTFAQEFASILNAANYEIITDQDLQDALTEESLFKVRLEVAFDDFAEVVFYRRGASTKNETLSTWWGLRKQTISFTNYDRVAVFIRFKDAAHFANKKIKPVGFEPGATIIKLFQNVPKADLEMLFPNSEVRMRPIDKVIIGASAAVGGAVVLVTKLGASIILVAALISYWLGLRNDNVEFNQQHLISLGLGLGLFGSFIFKEWSKFKNRKIKFMKALADNLYFKNLDNNAGVFHTIIDAAEEEDCKEAIIAYSVLLNSKAQLTSEALDSEIENWFEQTYHCPLDFEIADAIAKLERLDLIERDGDYISARTLDDAKARLDARWDNFYQY
ncbi:TMEM143 family protein [Pseudoalteromonas sp. G4]|uniref:TMEM143 family protein n=1 Tax=Pseudoalteromonas sp. G4 TaxID=2992761 RepID=UPI00237E76B0|nr:TMEM143 family protein [Pseudoalteromonas sp. G4]MDE3270579.1 TMEM143 family protein [Pseudoalteromonas sp. G4]